MSAFKVNGGIINSQTLTGSLRYFKMAGPFAWTVSDGSVNLPVSVSGGKITATTYFPVGNNKPVPNSAAALAFVELTKKCDVTIISCQPVLYGATTEIHFACSASAFGWGSDTPDYSTPPANMPEDLTAAAPQMQAAVRALPNATVYITAGAPDTPANAPVSAAVSFAAVTIVEVPFKLA
jgi:hypothetical protein